MDPKLLEAKLEMWKGKLVIMTKELDEIMQKRGEAMQMGDLRENAAYQMLSEDAETWRVKIGEVKMIIDKIEKDLGLKK